MAKPRWLKLVVLVGALALVAAACAEEEEPVATPPAATPTPEETPTPTPEETPSPEFTTLEEGVLSVGSCLDFPPFEFVEGGDEMGFDIDMTEEIASRLGLTVEWVRADFDTIFTAVAGGQFDMVAAASTITEEREEVVDFSNPYYAARQSLTVNVEETPDITSVDDLQPGDVVGVQRGTTGKMWAEENLVPRGIELKTYQTITPAFADLEAGVIVGIINDEPASEEIVKDRPSLEVVQGIDTGENYGFAFSPDNSGLREAVNAVLAEMIADGTYAEIFERWFPGVEVPPQFQP